MAKVWIVEDDETIIELYSQMLGLFGHSIAAVARDGEVALSALRGPAPLPDVIILDHRMPKITGLEVLGALPARAAV
ncbi:MAG: response regulator, partial [Actinomycetota bacterium]